MSLGSRLQTRSAKVGLMEYRQTWSQKATPAGRQYWAHTASVHRTSDSGSTGWPTPNCNTNDQPSHTQRGRDTLLGCAKLTGWPTPVANDDNKSPEAHLAMKTRMGERETGRGPTELR
jgi:hypothetical protein